MLHTLKHQKPSPTLSPLSSQPLLPHNLTIPSKPVLIMKDLNSLKVLEHRIPQVRKKLLYTRSFLLAHSHSNDLFSLQSPSLRKSFKLTQKLQIPSNNKAESFPKIFPIIKQLDLLCYDYFDGPDLATQHNYKQITRGFSNNIFKCLSRIKLSIDQSASHRSIIKLLLKSIRPQLQLKKCNVDFISSTMSECNILSTIFHLLSRLPSLEILSLKSFYLQQEPWAHSLSHSLSTANHLKTLSLLITDTNHPSNPNNNFLIFLQDLKPLTSLLSLHLDIFELSNSAIIHELANRLFDWKNLQEISLEIEEKNSKVERAAWISFYENLAKLSLKILHLKYRKLLFPIWRLIYQAISHQDHLKAFSLEFSEGLGLFEREFSEDLATSLAQYKELEVLVLVLPLSKSAWLEKVATGLERCCLRRLVLTHPVDSMKLGELEAIRKIVKGQNRLSELYLDLNYSKIGGFPEFNYDAVKSLLKELPGLVELRELCLKIGKIDDKYINLLKDLERLPSKLSSLRIYLKKSLNNKELLSLVHGIMGTQNLEFFYLGTDFGQINEETYKTFYDSVFQVKRIPNIRVDATNSIIPGLMRQS